MADAYAHIACCLDGSPAGDAALAAAMRVRALGPGGLTLVHVMEPGVHEFEGLAEGSGAEGAGDIRSWMERMVAICPGSEGVLLEGHPPSVVGEWARDAGVDLLVAVRHRGRVEQLVLGSFAQHLAYRAPCAMMLVHPPGHG